MTLDTFKILLSIAELELKDYGVAWMRTYSNNTPEGYRRKYYIVRYKNNRNHNRNHPLTSYAWIRMMFRLRRLFQPEISKGKIEVKRAKKPGCIYGDVFSVIIYWNKESNHGNG